MRPQTTGPGASGIPPLSPSPDQLASWGLDPSWSRRVIFEGADGAPVDWHVLDSGAGPSTTMVCVHGNPSWAYLWRDLLSTLPELGIRVIAVDQTGMGFSERGRPRRLQGRIDDLIAFCRQEVDGPLLLAAHDWGGPIAVGAAGSLKIEGLILANTAVAKPEDVAVPPLIAAARSLVDLSCRRSPIFVLGTGRMTNKVHREALRAPYETAERREAVRDFVADIPVEEADESYEALERVAGIFDQIDCPILLLWGGRDPVFHDRFLRDLRRRAPHASVERFGAAGHLVPLDEPIGAVVGRWFDGLANAERRGSSVETPPPFRSVLASLTERAAESALVYDGPDGLLSWAELDARSAVAAGALATAGLCPGQRVSLLIPPSSELLVAAAAIWRVGGIPVVADASAGILQLRRLVRASSPQMVVGTRATLTASSLLRFAPGAQRALFGSLPAAVDLRQGAAGRPLWHVPAADDVAAIVHTSGATGPAKAVRYTHGALAAQRDVLEPLLAMLPGEAFTTSFGPFMLLAPSLGMTCVRPDFKVSQPSALGYAELSAALSRAPVTTAWLSPASARSIIATAQGRELPLRLVMLAGAPIPPDMVTSMRVITGADVRAPYGMTECLPVTDGVAAEIRGPLGGSSTGRPIDGCELHIAALDDLDRDIADGEGWGEILIRAEWMYDGYDLACDADLAATALRDGRRFHRSGDVGYLHDGLLFHLGRRAHVITSAQGPLASVALEAPVTSELGRPVAAVGVGPEGAQIVCLVVSGDGPLTVAGTALRASCRAASARPIAAVLEGTLPVDRRHESKVDRAALATQASRLLAGR